MLKRTIKLFTLAGCLLMLTGPVFAKPAVSLYLAADSVLENSKLNRRDSFGTTLTPEEQKESKSDIKISAYIRKAVVKDKSLSSNGHNIKIITRDGVVTLRGPVENPSESIAIEKIARLAPGAVRIDNQLEVKAP